MDYKKRREEKNLTQTDVAKGAGISLTAYQSIERGVTKNPRKETLNKIKEILK